MRYIRYTFTATYLAPLDEPREKRVMDIYPNGRIVARWFSGRRVENRKEFYVSSQKVEKLYSDIQANPQGMNVYLDAIETAKVFLEEGTMELRPVPNCLAVFVSDTGVFRL